MSDLSGLGFTPGFRPEDLQPGPKEPASFGIPVSPFTHVFRLPDPCTACDPEPDGWCDCRFDILPVLQGREDVNIEDCPNCAGRNCPAYQEQRQGATLGLRVSVEAGLTAPDGWVHRMLRTSLEAANQVRDTDVFQVHTLPGDGGSTEYAALRISPLSATYRDQILREAAAKIRVAADEIAGADDPRWNGMNSAADLIDPGQEQP